MKNEVFEDYTELTAKQFAVMNYRYTMISGIIPIVEDKKKLAAAVKRTAEEYGVSKPTVRNYLKAYLKDRDKRVLAPVIREAKAMENKYAFDIRWALNKYYYTRDKRSLSDVYTLLIKERFYKDGALLEDRPTYSQFLYYYNKHKSTTNKIISRQGLSYFQRNERPLLGDGVQEYCNAIGIGMLDSTVADIYLINETGQLVGRPTITVCVDAYSGLCCGYSLGWEGGNFALRNLMQNIISDKVAYCRSFGIEISEADWNCKGCLPGKCITDKGSEYASENFSQLTELGIVIENLQAYRAELKGPVEQFFCCIQDYFKTYLKGKGIIEPDFQERGALDYRRQACLTLRQFETILLHCIIYYNSKRVVDFPFTKQMLDDGVKPYAMNIFEWARENGAGTNLLEVDAETLRLTMLPRTTAKFTRKGLILKGLRYKAEGFQDEYLDGNKVEAAYNPDNVNQIYLLGNGVYTEFRLIETRYADTTFEVAQEMKQVQKKKLADEKEAQLLAKIHLAEHIEAIAGETGTDTLSRTNLSNVRATRAVEKERQRLKRKDGC